MFAIRNLLQQHHGISLVEFPPADAVAGMLCYIILQILAATFLSAGQIDCTAALSEADIDVDELNQCECVFILSREIISIRIRKLILSIIMALFRFLFTLHLYVCVYL